MHVRHFKFCFEQRGLDQLLLFFVHDFIQVYNAEAGHYVVGLVALVVFVLGVASLRVDGVEEEYFVPPVADLLKNVEGAENSPLCE